MSRVGLIVSIIVLFPLVKVYSAGPDEVAGIRWDLTPEAVRQSMTGRSGIMFDSEDSSSLKFEGGMFAGFNVKSWKFGFQDGKFRSAVIVFNFRPGKDSRGWFADQDYHKIERMLRQKYGNAARVSGQNHVASNWEFRDPLNPGSLKTIELYRAWAGERNGLELTYKFQHNSKPVPGIGASPGKDL